MSYSLISGKISDPNEDVSCKKCVLSVFCNDVRLLHVKSFTQNANNGTEMLPKLPIRKMVLTVETLKRVHHCSLLVEVANKVIKEKSRSEVSLVGQDTIENVS